MRLFVAVNLPSEIREEMWTAARRLREAGFPVRWVKAAQLHLTLRFLGEVREAERSKLEPALEETVCGRRRFSVRLGGVGAFPSPRCPRVVWVGVRGPPDLGELQRAVDARVRELGLPSEPRAFHPHVTLGRARRSAERSAFDAFETVAPTVGYAADFEVKSVEMMRSELGRAGARHSVLSSFRLRDPAEKVPGKR